MKKSEFLTLIRHAVKSVLEEELKKNVIVRKIVKEEVNKTMKSLLQERAPAVVQRPKVAAVSKVEMPKTVRVETVKFSNNPLLNKVLNQTREDIITGKTTLPSKDNGSPLLSMLNEGTEMTDDGEWETMGGQTMTSGNVHSMKEMVQVPGNISRKEIAMLPQTTPDGKPVNPFEVPDFIKKALTKNYRPLIKAVDKRVAEMR